MRRALYRPQNSAVSECGQRICNDVNRTLKRSGARLCQFDGFCGSDSAYVFLPGTCSMCSSTVSALTRIMHSHGVSDWDWQMYDHGVQVRFAVARSHKWLKIVVCALLLYFAYLRIDVH